MIARRPTDRMSLALRRAQRYTCPCRPTDWGDLGESTQGAWSRSRALRTMSYHVLVAMRGAGVRSEWFGVVDFSFGFMALDVLPVLRYIRNGDVRNCISVIVRGNLEDGDWWWCPTLDNDATLWSKVSCVSTTNQDRYKTLLWRYV